MSDLVNLSHTSVVTGPAGFCLALVDGRLPIAGDHPLGLYREDCRHLRGYEPRLAGEPLRPLASDVVGSTAVYELTNPALRLRDGRELPAQSLRARIERRIDADAMVDRIALRSFASAAVELDLELRVDADFRPLLELRGLVAPAARRVRRDEAAGELRFAAIGVDGRERYTRVSAGGAVAVDGGRLIVPLRLAPRARHVVVVRVDVGDDRSANRPRRAAARAARADGGAPAVRDAHDADRRLAERPRIEVDDQLVDRVLRRSLLDLELLSSELDGHRYYAAGIPWYATLFGRDATLAALLAIAFDPPLAAGTLRLLARHLATRRDDERDAEPGKVIHELRSGEVAAAGLTPLARYYGTVDATPLFLCLLCEHADWSGSLDLFRELRAQVERAVRWIDDHGDLDGDGLLEYRCRSRAGLVNQGWKDSPDAIVDEHGAVLEGPIALVEVQGYALAAKRRLARLYALEGDAERAARLRAGAARLARQVERFWVKDRGCYALALGGDKRPSRAVASNQGHLLWSLAVPPARAGAICDTLTGEGAYSGWGVRTLSAAERAYNPLGYHTGSVWPHDTALLAIGLRRYGLDAPFQRVFDDLLAAAAGFPGGRLPELFAGYGRRPHEPPVPYPVACSPQAWSAAALPAMLVAGLGLEPDAPARRLRVVRPSLPRALGRLALRGLRVAGARVDLEFERAGRCGAVALTRVETDGALEVVVETACGGDRDLAPALAEVARDEPQEPR